MSTLGSQASSLELQDRERARSTQTARNSFGLLPQGIVNEKFLNL